MDFCEHRLLGAHGVAGQQEEVRSLMRTVEIFITVDPDAWQMEDILDDLNSAMSRHLSNWDFTITDQEVPG